MWPLRLAGPLLLVASALVVALCWERLPARWITHWGPDGIPDGWAVRSPESVFLPLVIGLLAWALLEAMACVLGRGREHPQIARASATAVRMVGASVAGVFAVIAAALPLLQPTRPLGIAILVVASTLGASLLAILHVARTVRRLRASGELPASAGSGLVYFNAADSRIFVPNPIGLGWTLNFGNPRAWFVLFLLLLPTTVALLVPLLAGD